jgi:hypothetical protein
MGLTGATARFAVEAVWDQAGAETTIEIASEIAIARIDASQPAFRK